MNITINKILYLTSGLFLLLKGINYYKSNEFRWMLQSVSSDGDDAVVVKIFIKNKLYGTCNIKPGATDHFQTAFYNYIEKKYTVKNIIYDKQIGIYLIKYKGPSLMMDGSRWPFHNQSIENKNNCKASKQPKVHQYKNITVYSE